MDIRKKITAAQESLRKEGIDGWLFYDFRRSNELACAFLDIAPNKLLTRRFLYWLPAQGDPVKVVSSIEPHILDHLPGKQVCYRTWQEWRECIHNTLSEAAIIAMEYSPFNALPYVSKVDAGLIELVKETGVEVVSSADLLQCTSQLDPGQIDSHLKAAEIADTIAGETWNFIYQAIKNSKKITEYDVQQFILEQFTRYDCTSSDAPICAVNANSANPHYSPSKDSASLIKKGDFILIDLWCKQKTPHSIFADITRVGVADDAPTARQLLIFNLVKQARDMATEFIFEKFEAKEPIRGWEVDEIAREFIKKAGYGDYFIHRTGHNIGQNDHGDGAHLDNYETKDTRHLLGGTVFSIEPGIYLPEEFGVRLEYDICVSIDGKPRITGGIQEAIQTL